MVDGRTVLVILLLSFATDFAYKNYLTPKESPAQNSGEKVVETPPDPPQDFTSKNQDEISSQHSHKIDSEDDEEDDFLIDDI